MYDILKDNSKFRKLKRPDLIKRRTKKIFTRNLKKQSVYDENTYENIYPSGSQPSRLYGTSMLHKSFTIFFLFVLLFHI